VKWIFSPIGSHETALLNSTQYKGLIVSINDFIPNQKPAYENTYGKLDSKLPVCVKGIALHSNDHDNNTISRGLHQVTYAIPNLISELVPLANLYRQYICPILVTTASLHILKRDLNLDSYQRSENFDDIADKTDALIYYQSPGPELTKYCNSIAREILREGGQQAAQKPLDDKQAEELEFQLNVLNRSLIDSSSQVMVVNYRSLETILDELISAIHEFGKPPEGSTEDCPF